MPIRTIQSRNHLNDIKRNEIWQFGAAQYVELARLRETEGIGIE